MGNGKWGRVGEHICSPTFLRSCKGIAYNLSNTFPRSGWLEIVEKDKELLVIVITKVELGLLYVFPSLQPGYKIS